MQPAATVCIVWLLVWYFDSICGVPALNREKQLGNERRKRRSTYYKGEGDLRPGDRWPVIVPACAEDEYYDVNVQACSRCSDACRPNIDLTFCASKCREYFRIHFESPIHPEPHSSFVVTVISSPDDVREERITDKPLFWTSVVSMTIAVAATVAIIVLCARRRKTRTSLVERRESNEDSRTRTLSEISDDREPEHRTLLHNTNERSPRNSSSRDEEKDFEASNNRSMYMTGGGYMTDRFGTGVRNQDDQSILPSMPSPDRDRHPTPEKVWQTNIHAYPNSGRNSTNVYLHPDKVKTWTNTKGVWKESNPSLSKSEFADDKRQLLLPDSGPPSPSSSTSMTYTEEASYASSMHEVSQSREAKRLSYTQENDETSVKEIRLIDLHDPRLPTQNDFTLGPKAMGILISSGYLIDDIRKLQVNVRAMRDNEGNGKQSPKTKTTLYNSSVDCDEGIATGECTDEPN